MNQLASTIGSVIISAKYKKMLYVLEQSSMCGTSSSSFPFGPLLCSCYTVLRVRGQCPLQGCCLFCLLIWPTLICFLIILDEFWLWCGYWMFGHCGFNCDTPGTSPQSFSSCVLTSLLALSSSPMLSSINVGVWFGVSKLTFILAGSPMLPLYPRLFSAYWEGKMFLPSAMLHI
jgi:hypothetical protein